MGLVDFHSHILPGIDDGSRSVEQSLALLRLQAEQGVQRVIATPHFYADRHSVSEFLERRQRAEEALRAAMEEVPGLPALSVGAEVAFFEGLSNFDRLQDLAISGTGCVMIEMPMRQWSDRQLRELAEIRQKQKLTPIMAHIERYMSLPGGRTIPDRLAELPVYLQVNAGFFERRSTRRMALRLLRNQQIHLLGSDCHDLETRVPNLGAAEKVINKAMPGMLGWIEEQQDKILTAQGVKDQLI